MLTYKKELTYRAIAQCFPEKKELLYESMLAIAKEDLLKHLQQ